MLFSVFALLDLSLATDWAISPSLALTIAFTSLPDLFTTSRFSDLKSSSCVDVCESARSRD
jgi:hypothetical protein